MPLLALLLSLAHADPLADALGGALETPEQADALARNFDAEAHAAAARMSALNPAVSAAQVEDAMRREVLATLATRAAERGPKGEVFLQSAPVIQRTLLDYEVFKFETAATSGVFPKRYFGYVDQAWDTADLEGRMMALVHAAVPVANAELAARGRTVRVTDAEIAVTWIAEGGALLLGPDQDAARSPAPRLDPVQTVGLDSIRSGFGELGPLLRKLDAAFGTDLSDLVVAQGVHSMNYDDTVLGTLVMYIWEKEIAERKLGEEHRPSVMTRPLDEQYVLSSLVYNSGILFSDERIQQILSFQTGAYLYANSEAHAKDKWRLAVLGPPDMVQYLVEKGYPEQPTAWSTVYHVLQRYGGWTGLRRFTDVFDEAGAFSHAPKR